MLTLVSGTYSSLESSFLGRVKELKKDPLLPLLIVSPSSRLLDRLQLLIADEGMAVMNLHFHSLNSLAREVVHQHDPLKKPILSDPHFYDTLVKFILKNDRPFRGLKDLALPEGFPPAVRSSLRDLMDAGVPPTVTAAIKEGFLGRDVDVGTLRELLRLYKIYLRRLDEMPSLPLSMLIKRAVVLSPSSALFKAFGEVIFYGFYDLTGLQVEFFESIVKNHASRLYFPYIHGHVDYQFAARFRDVILQPLIHEELRLNGTQPSQTAATGPATDPDSTVPQPEYRIINVSGLRDEAWWVAGEVMRLHAEEHIALSEMAVVARSRHRFSPSYLSIFQERGIPFTTSKQINLASFPQVELVLNEWLDLRGREKNPVPEVGSWREYGEMVRSLIPPTGEVGEVMRMALEKMKAYDAIKPKVNFQEFTEILKDRWERAVFPMKGLSSAGVSLLHAEAARGLSFQVLFLVGVEERVFPRIIREDPFLRDDARVALFNTLGYKIGQKMTALEEERLLFHLLVRSCTKKLAFVYQRTDEDGNVVGPSSYLREFCHLRGANLEEVARSLPRRALDKFQAVTPAHLSYRDLLKLHVSQGRRMDAYRLVKGMGGDTTALERGLDMQRVLHTSFEPTRYDGLISEQKIIDIFLSGRVSATAVETFGRCPFQFFVRSMLELKPLKEQPTGETLAPDKKGELVHAFLEKYYRRSIRFHQDLFDRVFEDVFESLPAADVALHPVLWGACKIVLKEMLSTYLKCDTAALEAQNWTPVYFEQEISARLPAPLNRYKWFGKLDRLDIRDDRVRVVDYKTGVVPSGKVALSMVRGVVAQPSLYILLAEAFLKERGHCVKEFSFSYQRVGKEDPNKDLSEAEWKAVKREALETLNQQLQLIQRGVFLIQPGDYCNWCDVSPVCRRHHSLSAYRAQLGWGENFKKIREKKVLRK